MHWLDLHMNDRVRKSSVQACFWIRTKPKMGHKSDCFLTDIVRCVLLLWWTQIYESSSLAIIPRSLRPVSFSANLFLDFRPFVRIEGLAVAGLKDARRRLRLSELLSLSNSELDLTMGDWLQVVHPMKVEDSLFFILRLHSSCFRKWRFQPVVLWPTSIIKSIYF